MKTSYDLREGTTEPIGLTLMDGTSAANITGYSAVAIFLRSADDAVTVTGTVAGGGITVTTAASGVIAINPAALSTTLLYSKGYYKGYIVVTDGSGKLSKFPNGTEIEIHMREKYTGDA